jgi:hypothetical protein
MRGWWNGIHRRLKISRRKAYGFESRLSYQVTGSSGNVRIPILAPGSSILSRLAKFLQASKRVGANPQLALGLELHLI